MMKNLQHYKDAVAVQHGYKSFNDAIDYAHFAYTNLKTIQVINDIINKAAKLYAEQCCKEQREACAEAAKLISVPGSTYKGMLRITDKQSILNTPLTTRRYGS